MFAIMCSLCARKPGVNPPVLLGDHMTIFLSRLLERKLSIGTVGSHYFKREVIFLKKKKRKGSNYLPNLKWEVIDLQVLKEGGNNCICVHNSFYQWSIKGS